MTGAVTEFMVGANGCRNRSVKVLGVEVLVGHSRDGDDAKGKAAAEFLAGAEQQVADLQAEVARLKAKVPPKEPARLMGTACVREDDSGRLWVLNSREEGWAAFGYWCDGWDDLFRRWKVRVTEAGRDEVGLWWAVVPAE